MTMRSVNLNAGLWAASALLGLLLSLVVAWHLLSALNFFYPQLYEPIGIGENIAEYGPLNRNRLGFATTGRAEHERLMAELVTAINHGGQGLAAIEYRDHQGKPIDSLLTAAEITHLRDVAKLVHWMNGLGVLLVIMMFALVTWLRARAARMPSLSRLLIKVVMVLTLAAGIVWIVGPVKVFYQLHIWLFPEKNQWFFYYQDSLMTTLLKAPVIFGPIAFAWVLTAVLVWWLLFSLVAWVMRSIDDN